jgi:hypothetical protein
MRVIELGPYDAILGYG